MVERAIDPRHAAWQGRTAAVRPRVGQARFVLLAIAASVAACDLIVKLIEPTETGFYHKRTFSELTLILAISAVVVYVVPLTRSRLTNVGAGMMVGGAFGNALSIVVFPLGVPNPITIAQDGWTVAFNPADLSVVAGFLLTTIGVLGLVIGRRHELRTAVER
jgi:hypothetical protein